MLKFKDETEANSVLMNGETQLFANIDTIGEIPQESTGIIDKLKSAITGTGWHVNVRVVDDEDGSVLESYKVDPEPVTPIHAWA